MARRALSDSCLAIVSEIRRLWPGEGRVRVAVSGGADSMALALGARWVHERVGEPDQLDAVIIDHGLQKGSTQIAERVAETLHSRGVESCVRRVEVEIGRLGVEGAARQARYQALTTDLGPADTLMVGHTLDDQAETVLLGIARSSGLRAIAGMAPTSVMNQVNLVRPLLNLRRSDTVAACQHWGVEVWRDPTNDDTTFLRNAVRHRLMPAAVEVLSDAVVTHLGRTATLARIDADYLDAQASGHLADALTADGSLLVRDLAHTHPAVMGRVIKQWLDRRGVEAQSRHIEAVARLIHHWTGTGEVALPEGAVVTRKDALLRITGTAR